MGGRKTESQRDADTQVLPGDLGERLKRWQEIDSLNATAIIHNIYRYEGDSTTTPKSIVGRVNGSVENPLPPDDHDIGEMFRTAGLYTILTRVRYRNAANKMDEKLYWAEAFRIGPEYEKAAAAPALPAATAVTAAAGQAGSILDALNALDKFADIMVKVRGEAPAPVPVDVQALTDNFKRLQKDNEARVQNVIDDYEARLKRLGKDSDKQPVETSPITAESVLKWGEVATEAVKGAKGVLDLFKPETKSAG